MVSPFQQLSNELEKLLRAVNLENISLVINLKVNQSDECRARLFEQLMHKYIHVMKLCDGI
jgi:hypothetical protein